MHLSAPAWWRRRKNEQAPLRRGEASRHLSLDAIDQRLSLRKCFPQPCRVVRRGGQNAAAVGCERRAQERAGVALEDSERLAVSVPQPRRAVPGGSKDAVAIRREHRADDVVGVALEDG